MRQIKLLPAIQALRNFAPVYSPTGEYPANKFIAISRMQQVDGQLVQTSVLYGKTEDNEYETLTCGTKAEWQSGLCDVEDTIAAGFVARRWADYL